MMPSTERQAVEAVRNDFVRRGYEVFLEPEANSLLPAELRVGRFKPDLIARRHNETIVVEVKTSGKQPDPTLQREYAKWSALLKDVPGWHFRVVWYEPDHIPDAEVPEKDDIDANLEKSAKLFDAGDGAAAVLLLWATFEAAAMRALQKEGVTLKKKILGPSTISTLIYHGVIDEEDGEGLRSFLRSRNLIAHGILTASVNQADFEAAKSATQRLLRS